MKIQNEVFPFSLKKEQTLVSFKKKQKNVFFLKKSGLFFWKKRVFLNPGATQQ